MLQTLPRSSPPPSTPGTSKKTDILTKPNLLNSLMRSITENQTDKTPTKTRREAYDHLGGRKRVRKMIFCHTTRPPRTKPKASRRRRMTKDIETLGGYERKWLKWLRSLDYSPESSESSDSEF
ncbi:ORF3 [Tick associated torque teno virus]|uniref:ORF3 n=1 Tax=Tick associated torque teno virus TaxID=2025480 RepID=A0A2D0XR56_9VIRU|nr:ORF3 [Tick associated torque teno virus]ASU08517.1 ORF3 [Tick associated torque teno virus]